MTRGGHTRTRKARPSEKRAGGARFCVTQKWHGRNLPPPCKRTRQGYSWTRKARPSENGPTRHHFSAERTETHRRENRTREAGPPETSHTLPHQSHFLYRRSPRCLQAHEVHTTGQETAGVVRAIPANLMLPPRF